MLRITGLIVVTAATLAITGCANNTKPDGSARTTGEAPSPTELAAYAASHQLPDTQPRDDLKAAAIINADRSAIRIYNFSNNPLSEVEVWVNGAWVQHVRGIGANGSVSIKTSDLYNHFGKSFASQSEPVTRVQLKAGDVLYNTMGPVSE